jgi:2-haloacid dehalogenase
MSILEMEPGGAVMKPVIAFDLVGTLLDLSALDPIFARIFGDSRRRQEWFSEVLKITLATTAMNHYREFNKITQAALKVLEERYQHPLNDGQREEILGTLKMLPPFSDVEESVFSLRNKGFRMVVLTNSKEETAEEMLKHAGILQHFDRVLSADAVQRLKPAPEPYRMVARELNIGPESILLVAAHSWDVAGAIRAGCQGCFLRRPDQVLDELTPKPNLVASDLRELSHQLSRLENAA